MPVKFDFPDALRIAGSADTVTSESVQRTTTKIADVISKVTIEAERKADIVATQVYIKEHLDDTWRTPAPDKLADIKAHEGTRFDPNKVYLAPVEYGPYGPGYTGADVLPVVGGSGAGGGPGVSPLSTLSPVGLLVPLALMLLFTHRGRR